MFIINIHERLFHFNLPQTHTVLVKWCTVSFRLNHCMLPTEICEMRKLLLTLCLAEPRQNNKEISNAYVLFIYGGIHYITHSFCKNVVSICNKFFTLASKLNLYCYMFMRKIVTTQCAHHWLEE